MRWRFLIIQSEVETLPGDFYTPSGKVKYCGILSWVPHFGRWFQEEQWALQEHFFSCFSKTVKDELATRNIPETLDDLISLTIRIKNHLRKRGKKKRVPNFSSLLKNSPPVISSPSPQSFFLTPASSSDDPMKLGRAHLSFFYKSFFLT